MRTGDLNPVGKEHLDAGEHTAPKAPVELGELGNAHSAVLSGE